MICNGTGDCNHSPCPHELKNQGRIDALMEKQGWSTETMYELIWRFVEESGLVSKLTDYLEQVAKEENEEVQDETTDSHG